MTQSPFETGDYLHRADVILFFIAALSVTAVRESTVKLVPHVHLVGATTLACFEASYRSIFEALLRTGASTSGND